MKWRKVQDKRVSDTLKRLNGIYNSSSLVRRVWAISDKLLMEKHFINICALYKQTDRFRVLDVGCGTGELINQLTNYFSNAEFIGIDSNKDSVVFAASRLLPRSQFVKGTFADANLMGSFDVVVCCEVFEHVLDTDHLLNILCAVCKSDGFISISTPSGWMYRRPSLYMIYKMLKSPRKYLKYCLYPERNWAEAVRMHPAIQPGKLRRALEKRGCKMISRQSSLWLITENGPFYRIIRSIERLGKIRVAIWFFYLVVFLDAAMNTLSLLRIFESRFVLLMKRK